MPRGSQASTGMAPLPYQNCVLEHITKILDVRRPKSQTVSSVATHLVSVQTPGLLFLCPSLRIQNKTHLNYEIHVFDSRRTASG